MRIVRLTLASTPSLARRHTPATRRISNCIYCLPNMANHSNKNSSKSSSNKSAKSSSSVVSPSALNSIKARLAPPTSPSLSSFSLSHTSLPASGDSGRGITLFGLPLESGLSDSEEGLDGFVDSSENRNHNVNSNNSINNNNNELPRILRLAPLNSFSLECLSHVSSRNSHSHSTLRRFSVEEMTDNCD